MNILIAHDAIHANIGHLPAGQALGYTTGSADIRWTSGDFAAHPGAVRICQDSGSDETADVLDIERGAATDDDAAIWVPKAVAAWQAGTRPGQRWPALYKSASGITSLVNTLIGRGIHDGVFLFVANWGESDAAARQQVADASGPFPIIGVQDRSEQFYDVDLLSGGWLTGVSGNPAGSTPHKTVAGDTLGSLAASRNMDVWSWLRLQQHLSGPQATHLVRHAAPEVGSTWRSQ